MHLLNVLSLSITIIHSWNRKQACLCLQWFQNEADHSITFLSCYLNVHVCIFYIFCRLKYCMMTKNWKFSEGKKFNKFLPLYLSQYTQNNYSFLLSANIVKAAFFVLAISCASGVQTEFVSGSCPCSVTLHAWGSGLLVGCCTFTDTRHFPGARGEVCGPVIPSSKKPNLT